jgi:hypothetical protein
MVDNQNGDGYNIEEEGSVDIIDIIDDLRDEPPQPNVPG